MVRDMTDYPLLLVPNMIPLSPPKDGIERLAQIVKGTSARRAAGRRGPGRQLV